MHKSDVQLNDLPRVAIVIRYLSSNSPEAFRTMAMVQ